MSDYHEQGIENYSKIRTKSLETSSEKNLRVLSMEDVAITNDCIKGIEIENGNGTCSKETLLPLEIEEVPVAMSDDCKHRTENLICDLHELVVKASSRTFNLLIDQHGNEEENVNDDKINHQIQKEVVEASIIDRTKSNYSVYPRRAKKNTIDTSREGSTVRQYESIKDINNVISPEKGIKRANSDSSATKKLTKRAKSSPPTVSKSKVENEKNVKLTSTFSTEFKFNTNSTLQCMESLISRRRIIYRKRQEAREKLAQMEIEALNKMREQKKKKVRRSPRTKKLNPGRRGQQSKNQKKDTLHNEFKKLYSPKESDVTVTYNSSCIFCNKNHDFHQGNKCLPKQYANEKKKGSWCTIL